MQGSWFCVELAIFVVPSHYSLRHGWMTSEAALYNWDFSGSPDGHRWCLLRRHQKDTSLAFGGGFATHTWEIPDLPESNSEPKAYRFFRVSLTGTHIGTGHE